MADLGFEVDTDALPDAKDFSPVTPGSYTVMITNSKLLPTGKTKDLMKAMGITDFGPEKFAEFRKTNQKSDCYLALEFDVQTEGSMKGRKVFHNLNLINESQKAAEIAAGQLKQILQALGIKKFSGKSEELHNKRLNIDVVIENGNDFMKDGKMVAGQPQNKIKKFYSTAIAATTATQPAAVNAAPWAR